MFSHMKWFTGKTVMITGASGNLGQAALKAFMRQGANLALVDRDVEKLAAAWSGNEQVLLIGCDLTDPDASRVMAARVADLYGKIDVLANIAGGFAGGSPVHETSPQIWNFMLALNAATVFYTSRAVIPFMRSQRSGKVINIAARAALKGSAGMAPYAVSKSAVIRLTESLSEENKHLGINVNCLLPSIIDTPENRRDMPDADFSAWVSPDALADVILFLASDAARAIHGAALPVCGLS
jgi:NAD(P)-dependent dehydrogenase (short-subunit alcohol dehydrogenase family)